MLTTSSRHPDTFSKHRDLYDSTHDFNVLMKDLIYCPRGDNITGLHKLLFTIMFKECFECFGIKNEEAKVRTNSNIPIKFVKDKNVAKNELIYR